MIWIKDDFKILSTSYDTINQFMSLGTDKQFRYLTIKNLIALREDEKRDYMTWLTWEQGLDIWVMNCIYKKMTHMLWLWILQMGC